MHLFWWVSKGYWSVPVLLIFLCSWESSPSLYTALLTSCWPWTHTPQGLHDVISRGPKGWDIGAKNVQYIIRTVPWIYINMAGYQDWSTLSIMQLIYKVMYKLQRFTSIACNSNHTLIKFLVVTAMNSFLLPVSV